ncbi:hypothetical protein GUJ93_ZPchr0002g26300 [Zizania palustris]|uniref:Secreted protein n=1 Tax=Zizania palustris TaxID=103762 RepID=A0A8J5S511_ZIZPA|nr:hypothetical protein GUJ93_ZPchr0002g26300 [Zizania palustris]
MGVAMDRIAAVCLVCLGGIRCSVSNQAGTIVCFRESVGVLKVFTCCAGFPVCVEFWAQCSCTRIAGRPPAHEKPGLHLLLLVIRHAPLLLWRCHSPIHSLIHAELQLLWWPGNHLCKAGWVRSLGDYLERLRAVLLLRRSESVIVSVSGSGGLVLLL